MNVDSLLLQGFVLCVDGLNHGVVLILLGYQILINAAVSRGIFVVRER